MDILQRLLPKKLRDRYVRTVILHNGAQDTPPAESVAEEPTLIAPLNVTPVELSGDEQAADLDAFEIASTTDDLPVRPKGPWNKKLPCGHIIRDKCAHYRDA